MNRRSLTPANILILGGGVVMLIASFLAFYSYRLVAHTLDGGLVSGGTVSVNAWDRRQFLIATLPALLGMFMALQVALQTFSNIDMPPRLLGLTWNQVHVVLSFQAALLMLALLARAKPGSELVTVDYGAGFWLMLVAAAALVVGALMRVAASGRRPRAI